MQLLRMTSTPMRYEMSSQPAHLEYNPERPQVQVNRQGGTWDIRQQQVRVQLDTLERRSSMGFKGMPAFMEDAAARGREAVMQATADYADVGNQLLHTEKGGNVSEVAYSRMMQSAKTELVLVPLSPTEISWLPGSADINYTPVKLSFDWSVGRARMDFVPGNFSMNITQYPNLQIEYLGGPIYVPPSSAPGFEATA